MFSQEFALKCFGFVVLGFVFFFDIVLWRKCCVWHVFFEVTLRLVGWQEENLQKIENGKKKIEEDIDQDSLIEQNVFLVLGKVGKYFAGNFFFVFRGKSGETKRFLVWDCFLVKFCIV